MRTLAILPVKRFDDAKTRLRGELDTAARRRLAEAMVSDVLDALHGTPGLDIVVVTSEPAVAALAGAAGATVLPDPAEPGQSPAARAGIAHALAHAYERVVMVPGDCPALDRTALAALLGEAHASPPSVTIVPDRHGTGTNALVLTPPDVIDPGFGPGSFERHRARAAAAGATWRVELPPGLTLDIDTPEDLAALRVALARSSTRTAALIGAP